MKRKDTADVLLRNNSVTNTKEHYKEPSSGYEWAIQLNRFNLYILGVWPERDNMYKYCPNYVFLTLTVVIIVVGLLLPEAYAFSFVWRNLPLLLDNISETVAEIISMIKLTMFWVNKKCLQTVLHTLEADWAKEKEEWEERVMINRGRQGRIVTLYGMMIMGGAICTIAIGPFFGMSLRKINNITDQGERFLPFQTYYPFDVTENVYFQISYTLQVVAAFLTGACFSGFPSFFSVLIFHVCSQLEILSIRIKCMNMSLSPSKNGYLISKHSFENNLKKIVKKHVHIIRTVGLIEESFTIVVLVEVMSVSTVIISMGVQFLAATNEFDVNKSQAFLTLFLLTGPILNSLLIIFVYCLAGEILSTQYADVANSIYGINWYMAPRKYVADMSYIILYSKYPLQLSAGKIIVLNFETYGNIIKSSAGYLSMLIAVRDK